MTNKATKKKKVPVAETPEQLVIDKTLTDMRRFHMSVDWAAWWEEYYLSININGTSKYKGIRSFAQAMGKNDLQKRFIEYVIGPPRTVHYADKNPMEVAKDWTFAAPMDWEQKRVTGGWYQQTTVNQMAESIATQAAALQALEKVGSKITSKLLSRYLLMAEQLDNEFKGHFFAEGLSFEDNVKRARLYVMLHKEVMQLQTAAQDLYAKNHGINFQMDGFQQMLLGARVSAETGDPVQQRMKSVLGKIIDMTLTKSASHDVPLPEEMTQEVLAMVPAAKPKPN